MKSASGLAVRLLTYFLLFNCLIVTVVAQSDTGVLFGVITDPAARTIVGARATLRNNATGATREYTTDERGVYYFTFLAPGKYTLGLQASGFKQYQDTDVRIQVAGVARIDITMEIGSTKEILDITGLSTGLNTENVSQGTVVGTEKIGALPLNGRQFIQLALLVPGVNPGGRAVQQNGIRQGQIGGLSIAGGRTNNTMFLLDGAMNTDLDYSTLNYSPSVDGIAEFQVQTAMVSAEYARSTINVVTKSGGNEYHGSAFEFLRNRVFDSRPFNLTTQSDVPKYQRNQFGATAGGPIVKEKLFTFFSYEGLRVRQAGANLTDVLVPTADQRNGDFSKSTPKGIFDPDNSVNGVRQQFPNNQIPASRLNPLALAAVNALPLPNKSPNLFANASGVLSQNNNNYSLRMDHNLTDKWSLFGRYSISDEQAGIPAVVTGRDRINNARVQSAVFGSTKTITTNLLNETRLTYSRNYILNGLPELSFNVNGANRTLPQFILGGTWAIMGGSGGFNNTRGGGTIQVRDNSYQLYDNIAWHKGRHNLKFGGEILKLEYNRFESPSTVGDMQFTAAYTAQKTATDGTGDVVAGLLLGLPSVASRAVGPSRIDGRQWSYAVYAQDDFNLSSKLTINLGIRYSIAPPMWDKHQQMASIDYRNVPNPGAVFAEGKTAFYKPTLFICGQSGMPRGCAYTDKNDFAPRVGIVYSANDKTVIRSGFGMFYVGNDLNPLFRLAAGLPSNVAQTLTGNNFTPTYRGFDLFGPATVTPTTSGYQQAGIDLFQRSSYSMQWNLTVQRNIAKDLIVEAGYMANLGLKLEQNVQPNNARPGTGAVDPRRPYAGLVYADGTQWPSYITVQGSSVPVGFVNYLPHSAQSNYHAGILRIEKRFKNGTSFLSSYTFSKAITNAPQFRNAGGTDGSENSPPQDSFNLRADRGLASFDVRNRWVNSIVYNLPFGANQAFLQEGLASKILGGWQISGIYSMQSGFPFTLNLQGDSAGVGAGTGGIFVRPNGVPGVNWELSGSQRSTSQFFNTAAFSLPAAGTFGNVGKNTIIGPGLVNLDLVLAKEATIREHLKLQFRAEAFNVANHSNYLVVGRIVNTPATFGRVLSQLDPRQIQFGAKLIF